jgi:hypothetical protein
VNQTQPGTREMEQITWPEFRDWVPTKLNDKIERLIPEPIEKWEMAAV